MLRAYSSSSGSGSALLASLLAINRVKVGVMRNPHSLAGASACSAETAEGTGRFSMLASMAAVKLAAARPGTPARLTVGGMAKQLRWLSECARAGVHARAEYAAVCAKIWSGSRKNSNGIVRAGGVAQCAYGAVQALQGQFFVPVQSAGRAVPSRACFPFSRIRAICLLLTIRARLEGLGGVLESSARPCRLPAAGASSSTSAGGAGWEASQAAASSSADMPAACAGTSACTTRCPTAAAVAAAAGPASASGAPPCTPAAPLTASAGNMLSFAFTPAKECGPGAGVAAAGAGMGDGPGLSAVAAALLGAAG